MHHISRRLFLPDEDSSKKSLSPFILFAVLLALEIPYALLLRHTSPVECLWMAPRDACIYTLVCLACYRLDLARLSISYLALPYLFFFPGWITLPAAIVLLVIFLYFFKQAFEQNTAGKNSDIGISEFSAFLLILAWVKLSGAGGHGYQTFDYSVHNSRLLDLINYAWPVRYGIDQNFVYYIGYFLPAATLGKLFGASAGIYSMLPWTLAGVFIAFRWLSLNSQWRSTVFLAAIFILFGPLDIIGILYLYLTIDGITPAFAWKAIRDNTDTLDFWINARSSFFVGNFLSNTFQLYWSPPQIIAGWICAGTLTHHFEKGNTRQAVFIFALLSVWAPLVMIGFFPMVAGAALLTLRQNWRNILTPANTLGAGLIASVFLVFYASGSMRENNSFWLFHSGNPIETSILFMTAWGFFGLAIAWHMPHMDNQEKTQAILLTIAATLLLIKTYGPFNDLLCRGSAPLMFVTLILLLRIARRHLTSHAPGKFALMMALMVPGFLSASLQINTAIEDYGHMEPATPIATVPAPNPNLGNDNHWFTHYLARKHP